MPTYDYECEKCGNKFEIFQKMSDKPEGECPKCKGKSHRLIGGGQGIIFKGTGFYETDYKKKRGTGSDKPPCSGSDGCSGCSKGK
ncbi:MAG: FmdB family zinc ribbon protein [Candidatus Omnitrophota bacterium]